MLDPVIPRLSALVPHFVNWKVKAVQEWHDEHCSPAAAQLV